jgi:catechol 2,3-dioxygenase
MAIAPDTTIGPVELTVADQDRSRLYYEQVIGLRVLERAGSTMSLGVDGTELLALVEEPGARPALGHTGLFHFALLLPERPSLARWLAHAARERVPLAGLSDHFVSEAIYLSDPDHHGIEIYADRPWSSWEGRVEAGMTTLPLDVDALLAELDDPATEPFEGLPAGTTMGHVHLRVAEIPGTLAFYRDVLGFELMASYGSQAAFLAAGGYHHHVGANTWQSSGAPPPPSGTAALRQATIVLPDDAERDRVAARVAEAGQEPKSGPNGVTVLDPSGNRLVLAIR